MFPSLTKEEDLETGAGTRREDCLAGVDLAGVLGVMDLEGVVLLALLSYLALPWGGMSLELTEFLRKIVSEVRCTFKENIMKEER